MRIGYHKHKVNIIVHLCELGLGQAEYVRKLGLPLPEFEEKEINK